jgi:hypothetical protein
MTTHNTKIQTLDYEQMLYWDDLNLDVNGGNLCFATYQACITNPMAPGSLAKPAILAVPFVYYQALHVTDQLAQLFFTAPMVTDHDVVLHRIMGGATFEPGHPERPLTFQWDYAIDSVSCYREDQSTYCRNRGVLKLTITWDSVAGCWDWHYEKGIYDTEYNEIPGTGWWRLERAVLALPRV